MLHVMEKVLVIAEIRGSKPSSGLSLPQPLSSVLASYSFPTNDQSYAYILSTHNPKERQTLYQILGKTLADFAWATCLL